MNAQGLTVSVDLPKIRENAKRISSRCGVPVIAVIKADAYGLGAARVVEALRNTPEVARFYCFNLQEAIDAKTSASGKPTICLLGFDGESPRDYLEAKVRAAVWNVERAEKLRDARPILCVDTGMQRFACPREQIDNVVQAGAIDEAFTHAVTIDQARRFKEICANRGLVLHAAASSLLDETDARFDFVRPGYALYRDTVHVSSPLLEARQSNGPIGYRGVISQTGRHGVIVGGYSNGLKPGPVIVNGERRRILECGMQTSYVEIGPNDRAGDEVVLLGDALPVEDVAAAWNTSAHETLLRLATSCRASNRNG